MELRDPDNNLNTYRIDTLSTAIARCKGDPKVSPMLVVKPPAELAAAVRPRLKNAADHSKTIRSHYRFFAYTDAAISLSQSFDGVRLPKGFVFDGNGDVQSVLYSTWAVGTRATVSTQFIWTALFEAQVPLEGDLEAIERDPLQPSHFTHKDDRTLDGLYLYTEDQRKAGAAFLHSYVYNEAKSAAGWLGEGLTDIADDLANQLVNCFASDQCEPDEAKDSEDWRNPGVGRAVSPDDFMRWDSPETGGSYGKIEQLAYRQSRWVPVHRWARTGDAGTLDVTVLHNGAPASGASVIVLIPPDESVSAATNDVGQSTFVLPASSYTVEAQLATEDQLLTKSVVVTVVTGETTPITIELGRDEWVQILLFKPLPHGARPRSVEPAA